MCVDKAGPFQLLPLAHKHHCVLKAVEDVKVRFYFPVTFTPAFELALC